jgi:hypothetical protein
MEVRKHSPNGVEGTKEPQVVFLAMAHGKAYFSLGSGSDDVSIFEEKSPHYLPQLLRKFAFLL